MKRIFERLDKIIRSNFDYGKVIDYEEIIDNSDDELKNIIDGLNSDAKQENKKYDAKDPVKMDLDLACKILEITKNASFEEVKNAYKQRIREYHPDKTEKLGSELKELSLRKTKEINDAFSFMKKYHNAK